MLTTAARLLRLLTLLQSRQDWPGADLAERLQVTGRTVRRDVDRLRELGYTVEARPGAGGGYRLGYGSGVPPLLLDEDEAVAVAVALRTVASSGLAGIGEAALQTLVKLDQSLPSALRRRVTLLHDQVLAVVGPGPLADPTVLVQVATCIRDGRRLEGDYVDHAGSPSRRVLEPHRVLHVTGLWYLLAWDVGREGWRTFRLDRLTPRGGPGPRFVARDLPDAEVTERVLDGVANGAYPFRCRMMVAASADRVAEVAVLRAAVVRPLDVASCEVEWGSHDLARTAAWLAGLEAEFVVHEPAELVVAVAKLSERLARAAVGGGTGST